MARQCIPMELPGGGHAMVTVEVRNPRAPCDFCWPTAVVHQRLCDFPIRKGKDTKRHTCSARLCTACTAGDDRVDLCPVHAAVLADHPQLGPRLLPLLRADDRDAHRVALDLIDEVTVVCQPAQTRSTGPIVRPVLEPLPFRAKTVREWGEYFTERAAIYEYLGELSREDAERRARADAGRRPRE